MQLWWKKGPMQKHPKLRLVVNILFLIFAVILLLVLYIILKTNLIAFIIMVFLVIGFPILQWHGRMMLEKQRVIAIYQFKNDQKINIDTKKVVIAYIEMFIMWWLGLFLAFLPPWPHAWAILFFPIIIIYTLQIMLWAHTWDDFDYKMRYYYLLHLFISVLCIIISLTVKVIFIPHN